MGERWQKRFRAGRVGLPLWARQAPERSLFRSNADGTWEFYAWDRDSGERWQVTKRPQGTVSAVLDPTGVWVWWFDDTDGDEFGLWRRRPFAGGRDEPAVPGLAPSYAGGLALGASGQALVGRSTDEGFSIHLSRPGQAPRTVYTHRQEGWLADLSHDEEFIAIAHSEHGDSRHMAVRVMRLRPEPGEGGAEAGPPVEAVADLWDGPGLELTPVGFAPGGCRLLVLHERHGRSEPLVWDPVSGEQREIRIDLPGDLSAAWTHDGYGLLVSQQYEARSQLYRHDLATDTLTCLDVPPGSVSSAGPRPDGTVEYAWSSSEYPPLVLDTEGRTVLAPEGEPAPPSVPVRDVMVPGPAGPVHTLVSAPADAERGPAPTVFLVHGGPQTQDLDAFTPDVAAWVDHGFTVVRVNYRGSTGYGSVWRDAIEGRVGLTELEDVKAVRDWCVASGLADPGRLVLAGGSWGGYLTLLGLGLYPDDWTAGIAVVPVADFVAAYADEMEALRAFDRSLFGGSPEQVPERYERSSPITYVERVSAPVLVLAGENDPRCPIRQIDNYVDRLLELGKPHEVHRFDAGHGSFVVEERVRHMAVQLDFALRNTEGREETPAPVA